MRFEELDFQRTPLGDLVLRWRTEPRLGVDVLEVKLGDEFLMSSLFTAGEVALTELALARLGPGPIDVVVGGLGLGYTAHAVLEDARVRSLRVVERLAPVIEWHRRGLVPLGPALCGDARCSFIEGDFFAAARARALDCAQPGRRFDAILVDIDHSPRDLLHASSASFYERGDLSRIAAQLAPGGVFGLWSDDPPDEAMKVELQAAFAWAEAHVVAFPNPLRGGEATNTVYLGFAKP